MPDTRPSAVVSGTAFDGLIINGTVNIYDWSTGKKGALLASGQTDGQGLYSISISTPDKPILVEVTNGYYIEEASGVQIQLKPDQGQKLLAVTYYRSGVPVTISATFATTVAAGYAEYLVSKQGQSPINAVINANSAMSQWMGFDIETTTPLDVSRIENASPVLTDSLRYGFVAAAISQLTKQIHIDLGEPVHVKWPSVHVIGLAYEDIRADGVLDGRGANGPLGVGSLAMSVDTFRGTLADYLLRFVVSDRNATTLGFDQIKDFAISLNQYTSDVFANSAPGVDVSSTNPTVEQFLPADGTVVTGTWPVSAIVSDPVGIASVEYYVDGNYVAGASAQDPSQSIVTTNFSDGSHQFEIRVTNLWGNTTSLTHTVTISNGGPSVAILGTQSILTRDTSTHKDSVCKVSFSVENIIEVTDISIYECRWSGNTFSPCRTISINPRNNTYFESSFDSYASSHSVKQDFGFETTYYGSRFTITATNSVGNKTEKTFRIGKDRNTYCKII